MTWTDQEPQGEPAPPFPHELFGGPGYTINRKFPDSPPEHPCECGHFHGPDPEPGEKWIRAHDSTKVGILAAGVSFTGVFHCTTADETWLLACLALFDGDTKLCRIKLTEACYTIVHEWPHGCFNWVPLPHNVRNAYGFAGRVIPNKQAIRKAAYFRLKGELIGESDQEAEGSEGSDQEPQEEATQEEH